MKKRYYYLLICSLILAVVGCGNKKDNITQSNDEYKASDDITPENIDYNSPDESTPDDNDESFIIYDSVSMTLEERMAISTNIFVGTYTGTKETYGIYEDLLFDVGEQLKGEIKEKQVWLRMIGGDTFKIADNYEKNKSYIVSTEKSVSPYEVHDNYLPIARFDLNDGDLEEDKKDNEEFIKLVKKELESIEDKSDPNSLGSDYIRSDDWKDIVEGSTNVAEVIPLELVDLGPNDRNAEYKCKVIKNYKGELKEEINIVFINGTVETGETYLVLLDIQDVDLILQTLSSPKSAVDIKDKETVSTILKIVEDEK